MTTNDPKRLFLDTSVVVDLCFWDQAARKAVESTFTGGAKVVVTPYVLFELARGFLSYLIVLHNKTLQFSGTAEVVGYARRLFMQRYRSAAVLQSYEMYLHSKPQGLSLTKEQELNLFRGDLSRRIRRGWTQAANLMDGASNACNCRDDLPAPATEETGHYRHAIPTASCGILQNCGVRDYLYTHEPALRKAASQLASLDAEMLKRCKALVEMLKLPKKDFQRRSCWDLGDILIVHEAPANAAIVTKNPKHHEPIGKIFSRRIVTVPKQA